MAGTAYTDAGLTDGTPYFYVVSAVAGGTEGPRSDEAMGVPVAPPAAVGSPAPAAYGYTADGLRAWKSVGGATTYFLYDGATPLCELDGAGSVTATDTWGPDGLLSRNVPAPGQASPSQGSVFYAFDPQGSVSLRLDASASVLGSYLFDAYGLRTGTDAPADPYAGFLGQWGGYADAETGLTLLGERYYDAGQGRFLTRDPAGYAGGQNLYAYSYNDPVNLADPSGLCAQGDGDPAQDLSGYTLSGRIKSFLGDPEFQAGSSQRRDFSGFVQGLPGGFLLSGYGAVTGQDLIGGQHLSGWEQALAGGSALLGIVGMAGEGGGGGTESGPTQQFIDDAIAKAEALSLRPYENQRDVNWQNVWELTNLARQNGNWDFLRGDELINIAQDGPWLTINNGMHRILASLMSGVPLPDEMHMFRDYYSPSRPW